MHLHIFCGTKMVPTHRERTRRTKNLAVGRVLSVFVLDLDPVTLSGFLFHKGRRKQLSVKPSNITE